MTVKAWLEGDPTDLAALADLSPLGDVRVVRDEDEDRYYLAAPEIDNPPNPGKFNEPAESLLGRLNGLGRTRDTSFRPVSLGGIYADDTGGVHIFAPTARLEIRSGFVAVLVTGADGEQVPVPPSPWPDRFAQAATNSDVAEVLEIMGRVEPLDWFALYKVHEIIRATIKQQTIPGLGWATRADDSAFTGSANLPGVSGRDARHARAAGTPRNTMTLDQGRAFISNLVIDWLDWLK